jgi:hypothetical protein
VEELVDGRVSGATLLQKVGAMGENCFDGYRAGFNEAGDIDLKIWVDGAGERVDCVPGSNADRCIAEYLIRPAIFKFLYDPMDLTGPLQMKTRSFHPIYALRSVAYLWSCAAWFEPRRRFFFWEQMRPSEKHRNRVNKLTKWRILEKNTSYAITPIEELGEYARNDELLRNVFLMNEVRRLKVSLHDADWVLTFDFDPNGANLECRPGELARYLGGRLRELEPFTEEEIAFGLL